MSDYGPPPVEPAADLRVGARHVRALYVALVESGFTPTEALTLVSGVLSAAGHPPTTS